MLFLKIKILFPSWSRSSEASYSFAVICILFSRGHLHLMPVTDRLSPVPSPEPHHLPDDGHPPRLNPGANLSFTCNLYWCWAEAVSTFPRFSRQQWVRCHFVFLVGLMCLQRHQTAQHRPPLPTWYPLKVKLLTLKGLTKGEACWLSDRQTRRCSSVLGLALFLLYREHVSHTMFHCHSPSGGHIW